MDSYYSRSKILTDLGWIFFWQSGAKGNCRQMMYCYDKSMNVIVYEDTKVKVLELLKYPCD